eukprot:CAMPEP_0117438876 /NCGR_PEP_ID=MMETSP0759-20121206/2280_1 /TAXON_ID=63605 /ORGANISM="Percolomonas cosmopolitus, Strain WS" /LENGTH=1313 /DNA_ID=CAMNT_0005230583 /DNA_START=228 /DNA_END=4166 /DNA_ORIENTATION=-
MNSPDAELIQLKHLLNSSAVSRGSASGLNTSASSLDYSLDKDAISLLKNQLSQIKQIKLNNERKDKMIKELHQHIEELMRFKDEAFHLNSEVKTLREKLRGIESESRLNSSELMGTVRKYQSTEQSLKEQLRVKNDELISLKQEHARRMETLNSKMSTLVSEYEQLVFQKQSLEKNLRDLEESSRLQADSAQRSHHAARSMVEELNDSTQRLTNEKSELQMRAHDLEQSLRQSSRLNDDRQDTINHLNSEIHKLERDKLDQAARISDLEQKLLTRDETIHGLNEEANKVPELKRELEQVPVLRGEVEQLRSELSDLHQEHKKVRAHRDLLESKNTTLQSNYADLQKHADDFKRQNQLLKDQLEELRDVDSQRDFLHKQSDHLKQQNNALKDEISDFRISETNRQSRFVKSLENLKADLSNVHKMIDHVVAGGRIQDSLFNVPITADYSAFESIRSSMAGVQAQVVECLNLVEDLRERSKVLEIDLDKATSTIRSKDEDLANSYQSLLKANDENEENKRVMKRLSDECDELSSNLDNYKVKFDQSQKELDRRRKFAIELFLQLQRAADREFDPTGDAHGVSWENFKLMLSEFVSVVIMKKESLEKDIKVLDARLRESESQLQNTKDKLTQAWDTAAHDKAEMEHNHNAELDDIRHAHEDQKHTLVTEFNAKRDELEQQLEDLTSKYTALELQFKKSSLMNDMLQNDLSQVTDERSKFLRCVRLLARGVRPMRNRIDSLIWQKRALLAQNRQLEESRKKILAVVEEVNNEFRTYDDRLKPFLKPRRLNVRVLGLAVIARNRLNRLFNARRKDGRMIVKQAGSSEVIQLLNENEVSSRSDLPQCATEDHSVENFMQLISILDPKLEHYQFHDDANLRSLKEGFEMKRLIDSREKEIYEISMIDNVKDTADSAITTLRRVNGQRNKLMRDAENLEKELIREQQKTHDLEENIRKKQELIDALDIRIQSLERENSDLISPQKYNALQNELERIQQEKNTLQHQRDQFKVELEDQIRKMSNYRTEGQNLTDSVRDYHFKLEQIRRELKAKKEENDQLANKLKRLTEEMVEVSQEKKKFQYMVTELSTQNMLRSGTFTSPSKNYSNANLSSSAVVDGDVSKISAMDDDDIVNQSSASGLPTARSPMRSRQSLSRTHDQSRVSFADESFRSTARSPLAASRRTTASSPARARSTYNSTPTRHEALSTPSRFTDRSPNRRASGVGVGTPTRDVNTSATRERLSATVPSRRLSSSRLSTSSHVSLHPLIQDLSNSQQVVHALSEANARAEREMRELDVELQRARESLSSLRDNSSSSRYKSYD